MQAPLTTMCEETVAALAMSGKRLTWGYGLYALYYIGIAGWVIYHGVRWANVGQVASDVSRLSNVLAPLVGYIAVNMGLAVGVRYLVTMHEAARWAISVAAIILACLGLGLYILSAWSSAERGFPHGALWSQGMGLLLAAGFAYLAYRLTYVVYALQQYMLIEDRWLPKFNPAEAHKPLP